MLNPHVAYKKDAARCMFEAGGNEARTVNRGFLREPCNLATLSMSAGLKATDPLTDFLRRPTVLEAYSISAGTPMFAPGVTSSAQVEEIYDHQGLDTIKGVEIEAPAVFSGFVSLSYSTTTGDSYLFTGTLENQLNPGSGEYPMLVRVTDTQDDPNLGPIQAWQIGSIQFAHSKVTALAKASQSIQLKGKPVEFMDNGSWDSLGGAIVKYEWDWNNDGTFDEEGIDVLHTWGVSGTYQVQFRASNAIGDSDVLDKPLEIRIVDSSVIADAIGVPSIQKAGKPINFFDNGSYDLLGGTITKCEWDWNNDGTFDEEGANVWHTWTDYGTYYVQFRATNDLGETDVLDTPLVITIRDKDGGVIDWAKSGYMIITGMAVDNLGNVYVTGYFKDTVDFDPGPGTALHTSNGGYDFYLCKFTGDLNFIWAQTWGSSSDDSPWCPSVDTDNSGGVYVSGTFGYSMDFDP